MGGHQPRRETVWIDRYGRSRDGKRGLEPHLPRLRLDAIARIEHRCRQANIRDRTAIGRDGQKHRPRFCRLGEMGRNRR